MKHLGNQDTNPVGVRRTFLIWECTLIGGLLLLCGSSSLAQQPENIPPQAPSEIQIVSAAAVGLDADPLPQTSQPVVGRTSAKSLAASQPGTHLTFNDRFRMYAHSYLSPQADIGPLLGAGLNQWIDYPKDWGRAHGAFGKRVGSLYGQDVINRTLTFGVAAIDHEDPRFFRSDETGAWKRTIHDIKYTFLSKNTHGGDMPAYSRFIGLYGAAAVANVWEPTDNKGAGHVIENGTIALGADIGWRVFTEYWPDIRNKLHGHHQ
jgi:hypothetical protein